MEIINPNIHVIRINLVLWDSDQHSYKIRPCSCSAFVVESPKDIHIQASSSSHKEAENTLNRVNVIGTKVYILGQSFN